VRTTYLTSKVPHRSSSKAKHRVGQGEEREGEKKKKKKGSEISLNIIHTVLQCPQ
jgi:hypothetical protein